MLAHGGRSRASWLDIAILDRRYPLSVADAVRYLAESRSGKIVINVVDQKHAGL